MRKAFGIVALAMMAVLLNGCAGRKPEDISSSPKYNFSEFAGTVWKTKTKVAVVEIKQGAPAQIYLLPPQSFDPAHPKYTPPAGMKMIWVLPEGTRLRLEQLLYKETFETTYTWVTASLDDGTVVRLGHEFLTKDFGVNPDMLEKAK